MESQSPLVPLPSTELDEPPRPLREAEGPLPFFGLTPEDVRTHLTAAGWQGYRAEQVLDWVFL